MDEECGFFKDKMEKADRQRGGDRKPLGERTVANTLAWSIYFFGIH